MSAETVEKIFAPFFTTKGVGQGTGMGLSTVQGIINQFNGMIKVSSNLGHGSNFELYVPLNESPMFKASPVLLEAELQTGGEHILLLDDDELLVKLGEENPL